MESLTGPVSTNQPAGANTTDTLFLDWPLKLIPQARGGLVLRYTTSPGPKYWIRHDVFYLFVIILEEKKDFETIDTHMHATEESYVTKFRLINASL